MSRRGFVKGHLRGHFGTKDNGDRVFHGKWINRSGEFEGLLRGTWAPHPNENANGNAFRHAGGWFKGRVYDANEVKIGVLKGKYKNAPHFRGGFFQGRWKLDCSPDSPDDDQNTLADGF